MNGQGGGMGIGASIAGYLKDPGFWVSTMAVVIVVGIAFGIVTGRRR